MPRRERGTAANLHAFHNMPGHALSGRFHVVWLLGAVHDLHRSHKKVLFTCDTLYWTFRGGENDDDDVVVCPASAEIGGTYWMLSIWRCPLLL